MTLWSIARSPLIMGGNMPKNDEFTLSLMTNDEVIAVNQQSTNNRQLFAANNKTQFAWVADVPGSKDKYVAIFNASPLPVVGRRRGGPPGETPPRCEPRRPPTIRRQLNRPAYRFRWPTSASPAHASCAISGQKRTLAPSTARLPRRSIPTAPSYTVFSLKIKSLSEKPPHSTN